MDLSKSRLSTNKLEISIDSVAIMKNAAIFRTWNDDSRGSTQAAIFRILGENVVV